jgi:hypothetical protein
LTVYPHRRTLVGLLSFTSAKCNDSPSVFTSLKTKGVVALEENILQWIVSLTNPENVADVCDLQVNFKKVISLVFLQ